MNTVGAPRAKAISKVVPVLIAAVLLAVGLSALAMPELLATGFGIPIGTRAARAYVIAAGTRDIAMGCWLLALVWLRASHRVLAVSMFALALVAIGDAVNVYAHSGMRVTLVAHVGGALVLLAVGAWHWGRKEGGE